MALDGVVNRADQLATGFHQAPQPGQRRRLVPEPPPHEVADSVPAGARHGTRPIYKQSHTGDCPYSLVLTPALTWTFLVGRDRTLAAFPAASHRPRGRFGIQRAYGTWLGKEGLA